MGRKRPWRKGRGDSGMPGAGRLLRRGSGVAMRQRKRCVRLLRGRRGRRDRHGERDGRLSFEDGKVGETLFGCRQGAGREKGERLEDGAPSDGGRGARMRRGCSRRKGKGVVRKRPPTICFCGIF